MVVLLFADLTFRTRGTKDAKPDRRKHKQETCSGVNKYIFDGRVFLHDIRATAGCRERGARARSPAARSNLRGSKHIDTQGVRRAFFLSASCSKVKHCRAMQCVRNTYYCTCAFYCYTFEIVQIMEFFAEKSHRCGNAMPHRFFQARTSLAEYHWCTRTGKRKTCWLCGTTRIWLTAVSADLQSAVVAFVPQIEREEFVGAVHP